MNNIQVQNFYYRAYGFTIQSSYELPYPDVEPIDDADVVIGDGPVPETLGDDAYSYGIWQGKTNNFLLIEETIGRILVQDGCKITIQCSNDVDPRWVSVYINGSALAALLQQRGLLPLHASAIQCDGGAILFAGASGVGKSTLAATLHDRGYASLSDDVSGIRIDGDGAPVLEPSAGHLRLWKDVTEKLNYEIKGKRLAAHNFQKFEFPVSQSLDAAIPVKKIYILEPLSRKDISLRIAERGDAFRIVRQRSYRSRFHLGQNLQGQHFKLVSVISSTVPVVHVTRPNSGGEITDLTDIIEQDMKADTMQTSKEI